LQQEKTFQQATVDFSTLFHFKSQPSQDTTAFSDGFYGTELGLPLILILLTWSDRLAHHCFSTFLAGTRNYLAGIHNYFFTIGTMTTVHHGLPSLAPRALSVRNCQPVSAKVAFCFCFVRMIVPWVFLTLPACSLI